MAKRGVKVLPDKAELLAWDREGLSYSEMIDRIHERTGETVHKSALSVALKRAGVEPRIERYRDMLPWNMQEKDSKDWIPRLLRAEARRRRGLPISARPTEEDVVKWVERLTESGSVVHYEPDGVDPETRRPKAWWYVERIPEDEDIIRTPEVEAERLRRSGKDPSEWLRSVGRLDLAA